MQNRRQFLKFLGTGLAVGAVASQLPIEQVLAFNPHRAYFDMHVEPLCATVAQFQDYSSFGTIYYDRIAIENLKRALVYASIKPFNGEYYGVVLPQYTN